MTETTEVDEELGLGPLPDASSPQVRAPNPGPVRWMIPGFLAFLTLAPLGGSLIQREISLWHAAAGHEATLNRDRATCLKQFRRAVQWNPTDFTLRGELVNALLGQRETSEAIQVADQSLRLCRVSFASARTDEARIELVSALNQAAYARALANQDLSAARKAIDESISLLGDPLGIDTSLLDTRGYIAYLQGDNDQALTDLEDATDRYARIVQLEQTLVRRQQPLMLDDRGAAWRLKFLDESLAVFLQHRGWARQRAGDVEAASEDFARAKELGFSPENGVW